MALIDRIFHDEGTDPINNHAFSASLLFLAKGSITRAQVVTAFNMDTTDEVQLDELIAFFNGLSNQDKREFHSLVEAAGNLAETAMIPKSLYKTFLGMA